MHVPIASSNLSAALRLQHMISSIVWLSTPALIQKTDKSTQCDIGTSLEDIDGIDEEADKMPIFKQQLIEKLEVLKGYTDSSNLDVMMECEPMVTASELMAHAIVDGKNKEHIHDFQDTVVLLVGICCKEHTYTNRKQFLKGIRRVLDSLKLTEHDHNTWKSRLMNSHYQVFKRVVLLRDREP